MDHSIIINENHEDQSQELLDSIKQNLEPEPEPSCECCIYRVPKRLRMVNEKAYMPQLISIGPFYHGKNELIDMKNRKESYLQNFFKRISIPKQVCILSFIKNNERRIRNCYAESFKLDSRDFIKMILYDAIFILELFTRAYHREGDFYLSKPITFADIRMDILLLENQLPYFVLDELYKLAFDDLSFKRLCSVFFYGKIINNILHETPEVLHFTDFYRRAMLKNYSSEEHSKNFTADFPNAVKLQESGVRLKCLNEGCLLDIRLEKRKQTIPFFKVKELQIPALQVDDFTEPQLRNVMALEQLHYPNNMLICSYVDFMDRLIDTKKDVDLLNEKGIISNLLGDNASVANMINKLGNGISLSGTYYSTTCQELKAHYNNRWNHTKAFLKRVYFSNLWRGTATVAGVTLLLFNATDTVTSVRYYLSQ